MTSGARTTVKRAPPERTVVRAPMKLVIAGEYAVLEPGSPGIVAAVDRYATCTASLSPDGDIVVDAPGLGPDVMRAAVPEARAPFQIIWEFETTEGLERLRFARTAADIAYAYVAEMGLPLRPLAIRCETEGGQVETTAGKREKLGLGTSAATVVAVLAAVLGAHSVAIDRGTFRRQVLRLALVAHARAQGGRGSGIDVAASTVGGLLEYGRVDASWWRRVERANASPLELARGPWPGLHIDGLPLPGGMRLLAGFTGTSSPTVDLVAEVERWRRDRHGEHETFIRLSQRSTRGLAMALRKGDRQEIVASMALARKALNYLASRAGVEIETPALERLASIAFDAGGAGKLSGAGGGDCGIAIAFDPPSVEKIEAAWREAGITPIPIALAPLGFQEVRP